MKGVVRRIVPWNPGTSLFFFSLQFFTWQRRRFPDRLQGAIIFFLAGLYVLVSELSVQTDPQLPTKLLHSVLLLSWKTIRDFSSDQPTIVRKEVTSLPIKKRLILTHDVAEWNASLSVFCGGLSSSNTTRSKFLLVLRWHLYNIHSHKMLSFSFSIINF